MHITSCPLQASVRIVSSRHSLPRPVLLYNSVRRYSCYSRSCHLILDLGLVKKTKQTPALIPGVVVYFCMIAAAPLWFDFRPRRPSWWGLLLFSNLLWTNYYHPTCCRAANLYGLCAGWSRCLYGTSSFPFSTFTKCPVVTVLKKKNPNKRPPGTAHCSSSGLALLIRFDLYTAYTESPITWDSHTLQHHVMFRFLEINKLKRMLLISVPCRCRFMTHNPCFSSNWGVNTYGTYSSHLRCS